MQYNIFQNDFYESRPGIPWAYRLTAFYGPIQEEVLTITKAIKEAHLPDQELKYYQVFFGGYDKRIPTRYQNTGTFALTFNEDCNLTAYKSILKLFRRSLDNREDDEEHYKYSNLQWELRLVVEILDPKNINLQDTKPVYGKYGLERDTNDMRVVARYEFGDCFIDKIEDIDLDYSSEEIVEWSLTVAFNSIKISYPGKKKLTLGAEDTFTETEFEAYDSYERYQKKYISSRGGGGLSELAGNGVSKFDKKQAERDEEFIEAAKNFGSIGGEFDTVETPPVEPDTNEEFQASEGFDYTQYSEKAQETARSVGKTVDKILEMQQLQQSETDPKKLRDIKKKLQDLGVTLSTKLNRIGMTDEEKMAAIDLIEASNVQLDLENVSTVATIDMSDK